MKFKELTKIPIEQCFGAVEPTIETECTGYDGRKYKNEKQQYSYQATRYKDKNDLLIVTIFHGGFFKLRIFLTSSEFCNQVVDRKKPSNAMIYNVRSWYGSIFVPTEDADNVIISWMKDRYFDMTDPMGITLIQRYQENIREKNLKEKYRKIKESIDFEMLKIKPLPKDIKKWANDNTYKDRNYIFYHPTEHFGECSCCGSKFTISPQFLKHKDTYFCPKCKTRATLISQNRWRNMNKIIEKADLQYIQPTKNGFCVRKFQAVKTIANKSQYSFSDDDIPQGESFCQAICLEEYKRDFYEDNYCHKSFMYDDFNQTGEYRWCYSSVGSDRYYYSRVIMLYTKNLNTIIKRDKDLKYIPVKKILDLSSELNFVDTLKSCKRFPCVEYLYKIGFKRLTVEVCRYGNTYSSKDTRKYFGLNYDGKNIMELLGVGKQDVKLLAFLDVNSVELELYKYCKGKGIFDLDAFKWCLENFEGKRKDDFFEMLEYTTLCKAVNYIKKQKEILNSTITNILYDWRDYKFECEKLKYSMTADVLFPADLGDAHEKTTTLTKLLDNKKRCDKCRKGCEAEAERLKPLSFETSDYLIRLAESPEEIITEGAVLHHCVGGYVERHSEGKTHIFVIRKISEPDKPFYTLELDKNMGLVQCRGYKNNREDNENQKAEHKLVDEFVAKWLDTKINKKKRQKAGAA